MHRVEVVNEALHSLMRVTTGALDRLIDEVDQLFAWYLLIDPLA